MFLSFLARASDKRALHTADVQPSPEPVLVTENLHRIHGTFAAQSRSTGGTTILAAPEIDQEIVLTDLIVSTDRVASSTLVIHWTDDAETIVIYSGNANDAPINFAIAFAGRWAGWKNARIEMVTNNTLKANIAVGYYKLPEGLTFAQWDAIR